MPGDAYLDLEHDSVEDADAPSMPVRIEVEEKLTGTAEERRRMKQKERARTGSDFEDWMDPRNPALWQGDTDDD